VNNNNESARAWTRAGLAIALLGIPFVVTLFALLPGPRTTGLTVLRELILLSLAAVVAMILRRRERLTWDAVGLGRPAIANTALWVLIGLLATAAAIAVSLGAIHLFDLRFGSTDTATFEALPTWVVLLMVVRAGLVEEFFYRGYAIERLLALTDNRVIAIGLPLCIFAVFHYRQGTGGILIALLAGVVMTAIYLRKRNLWINISTHFLVDFIPNILLPLLFGE